MVSYQPAASAASHSLKLGKVWYAFGSAMLIAVAIVSLMPAPATGVSDKLAHLLTYFLLAGWFAVIAQNRVVLAWSISGLVGYGMLIELLQAQTGYRYAEWGDVLANAAGCAGGSALYLTPLRRLLRFIDGRLAAALRR